MSTQSINAKTDEIMSFLFSFENGGLCTLKEEVGQLSAKSMSGWHLLPPTMVMVGCRLRYSSQRIKIRHYRHPGWSSCILLAMVRLRLLEIIICIEQSLAYAHHSYRSKIMVPVEKQDMHQMAPNSLCMGLIRDHVHFQKSSISNSQRLAENRKER